MDIHDGRAESVDQRRPSVSRRHRTSQSGLQRTPTACQICRDKKVKCSGQSPCEYCTLRGIDCALPNPDTRRMYSVAQVRELQRKVAIYENHSGEPAEMSEPSPPNEGQEGVPEYDRLSPGDTAARLRVRDRVAPRGRPKTSIAPCRFCKKAFRRAEHLRRHERIHTQEKPFSCHCGCRFSRQDLLLRHARIAHNIALGDAGDSKEAHASDRVDKDTMPGLEPVPPALDKSATTQLSTVEKLGTSEGISKSNNMSISLQDQDTEVGILNNTIWDSTGQVASSPPLIPVSPEAPQQSVFPDVTQYNWWDGHNFMDNFVPTQLLDTDYPLSSCVGQGLSQQNVAREDVGFDLSTSILHNRSGMDVSNTADSLLAQQVSSAMALPPPDGTSTSSLGQELNATKDTAGNLPWKISPGSYAYLCAKVSCEADGVSTGFTMPSRHPLCRYVEGYFRGFHDHLPFIHLPSLSILDISAELILAIAAVGALYKFEHVKGYELFYAAKALVSDKLHRQRRKSASQAGHGLPLYACSDASKPSPSTVSNWPGGDTQTNADDAVQPIQMIQALNILMAMASWGDAHLVPEALEMAGQLATLVRIHGISQEDPIPAECQWEEWARREEKRRTLFVTYVLFNLQSIAFNVPPVILSQEVALCLPSDMELWSAPTAALWADALHNSDYRGDIKFRSMLDDLLRGKEIHHTTQLSAFGNLLLIHGLVQLIFLERQTSGCLIHTGPSLPREALKVLEVSLRSWQRSWESTVESTLDPLSPKGPLAFKSTALLRIAYVRLVVNLGPHRSLQTRVPSLLANCVTSDTVVALERSVHTDRAVLQCIHALGIIVRAGVAFIARTHTQNWGIVHSLSNIECACLLSCWLRTLASYIRSDGLAALREDERALLGMVSGLIEETDYGQKIQREQDDYVRICRLAACTVRLWSEAYKGVHVFQMVHVVAQGLSIAADTLESPS